MFDNILGQGAVIDELTRDLNNQTLPGALLFHGPPLAGKLTTALELARILQCRRGTAEWGCDCQVCAQNRLLEHPYLLLLGPRNFVDEIRAASDALLRTRQTPARFLLIRAVRKLIRRSDRVLWENNEKRLSPVLGALQELEEALEAFLPGVELPEREVLERKTVSIIELAEKISKKLSADTIPVHQIRRVSYWAHTTAGESKKVIIIENADRMLDASRNALLKILEEPPAEAYFILITPRKERIIPTLKSRLRQIQFAERTHEISREVLKRIFRETSGTYDSLKQYFLAWSTNPAALRRESERFYRALMNSDPSTFFHHEEGDSPFLSELEDRRIFASFLAELTSVARDMFAEQYHAGTMKEETLSRFERWNASLRSQAVLLESLNLNPRLLTENLFQDMLAAV